MPPIRFERPVRRYSHIPFVSVGANTSVIPCAFGEGLASVFLHYLDNSSAPCGEPRCRHCEQGLQVELHTYMPVLWQNADKGQWTKAVLDIGNGFNELGQNDWRGFRLWLWRGPVAKGQPARIRIKESKQVPADLLQTIGYGYFDVRPRICERYNIEPARAAFAGRPTELEKLSANADDEHGMILTFPSPDAA